MAKFMTRRQPSSDNLKRLLILERKAVWAEQAVPENGDMKKAYV